PSPGWKSSQSKSMRALLGHDPLLKPGEFHHEESPWPAKWIAHPDHLGIDESVVLAFRLRFTVGEAQKLRIHVSADQRYELFLDGVRIGRGPERGDRLNWFYETHEVAIGKGEDVLVGRTWWLREGRPSGY